MSHLTALNVSADLDHLEPAQVPERLLRFRDRIPDGALHAAGGRPDELDGLVDMVRHPTSRDKDDLWKS
jgi:hypothetical protein